MSKDLSPLVTVIVLHYQELALTIACVESVLQTIYPAYTILIVDNGSPNNSYSQLIKKYKHNDKVIIRRSPNNRYFAGGFNFGAQLATGTYLILLSNDTIVEPDWISKLVAYANSRTFIQPRIMRYDKKNMIDNVGGQYTWWGIGKGINVWKTRQNAAIQKVDFTSATTMMVPRKIYLKLGGYDEWFKSHYEDVDLCLRAKKIGIQFLTSYHSVIYHKGSATYQKHAIAKHTLFDVRKNRIQTIVKNFTGIQLITRLTACILIHMPSILADMFQLNIFTIRALLAGITRKQN